MTQKQPVNILMVDDQPAKLLSYEVVLASLGENLIRANSGTEALDYLLRHEIAVVLVDVCMPELNGFELASMIRNHPRYQKTAVILVSGVLVEDMDRLKGYDSGAVNYISVPIVPEILRAKVSVFAELYRKTEELARLNQELESRVAQRTAEIGAAAALLRQSEERMRLVLNAAGIEGWTWDIGRNEIAWVRPSGSPEQPVEADQFLANIHPGDREGLLAAFQESSARGIDYQAEFRVCKPQDGDGAAAESWWLGRGTVILDQSKPASIAGININITDRKKAEEERARLLQNAEEAQREAEHANRLKDEFLATLSHELRTPLNAITGWSHLLLGGELDETDHQTAVETIHRNAVLQAQLIADLLDVSRIVSGKLRLEVAAIEFGDVVRNAMDTVRPLAEAKEIELTADLPAALPPVSGDFARLQQVVANLLSNAVKFSDGGGHVKVSLTPRKSQVELRVEDDGPGIQPEFLPHIFERFRQADPSSTRSHQGLGLGLTIVRHLVEMHGGEVVAANRASGRGAVFTVTLPLQTSVALTASATAGPKRRTEPAAWKPRKDELKDLRLLVVDDEADGREVASRLLERCGAEVMVAASAAEAFRILRREQPHILIADIEMPVEDGYGLLRRIRALAPPAGKVPALALTAYAGALDRAKLLNAGFHRHVAKPVNPGELVAAIASLAEEFNLPETGVGAAASGARGRGGRRSE